MKCCEEVKRRGMQKERLPVRQRAAYGVGHILNDLTSSVSFTYLVIYLTKVAELSNRYTGLVILFGQIADAISNWTTGIVSDRTISRYGRRKKWHLVGTLVVTVCFPLLLVRVLDPQTSELLKFGYFVVTIFGFQCGWGCVQVSHLSLIPEISNQGDERMELNVIRTTLTFVCGIYVYLVTWVLLGQSSERKITPNVWKEFMYLSFIILITGNLCNIIFHVITKEPSSPGFLKKQQEKHSASNLEKDQNVLENLVSNSRNEAVEVLASEKDDSVDKNTNRLSTKTKIQWLKTPAFLKTASIYVCSRVVIRISQTYLAIYLTETLDFDKEATAYFPLVVLASCAVSSLSIKPLSARLGHKIPFLIGTCCSLGASAWFFIQPVESRNAVYAATVLIGSGSSMMLVTSLSMIADLIGDDKSSGAFVYGVCALTYKLISGVVIAIIQELNPQEHSVKDCLKCGQYVRLVYSIVPGTSAMIALIIMTLCFKSQLDCKMRAIVLDVEVQADLDKEFSWMKRSSQENLKTRNSVTMEQKNESDPDIVETSGYHGNRMETSV